MKNHIAPDKAAAMPKPKPVYAPELLSVAKSLKSVRFGRCLERPRNCETVLGVEIKFAYLDRGGRAIHNNCEVITMETARELRNQLDAILND